MTSNEPDLSRRPTRCALNSCDDKPSIKALLRSEVKVLARLMGTPQNSSESPEAGCRVCKEYQKKTNSVKSLVLHLPLESFKKKDADKASQSADWFFTNVNAILNSSSHKCLCIHAEDLHFFDIFCQLVDERLVSLIPDDTLFHHNFHSWFHDREHLVFRFKDRSRDRGWSTFDFNTTVSLNKGRERRLAHFQFHKYMQEVVSPCAPKRPEPRNEGPVFCLDEEVTFLKEIPFQECAYHQAKDRKHFRERRSNDEIAHLASLLWDGCELGTYISAFSKVQGGGSVYFGIEEKTLPGGSKMFCCNGLNLSWAKYKDLTKELYKIIASSMAWFGLQTAERIFPVDIFCCPIAHRRIVYDDLFVLEVRVNHFHGVCFHKAEGPASFTFEGNQKSLKKMSLPEWILKNKYTSLKIYTAKSDGHCFSIFCAENAEAVEGV